MGWDGDGTSHLVSRFSFPRGIIVPELLWYWISKPTSVVRDHSPYLELLLMHPSWSPEPPQRLQREFDGYFNPLSSLYLCDRMWLDIWALQFWKEGENKIPRVVPYPSIRRGQAVKVKLSWSGFMGSEIDRRCSSRRTCELVIHARCTASCMYPTEPTVSTFTTEDLAYQPVSIVQRNDITAVCGMYHIAMIVMIGSVQPLQVGPAQLWMPRYALLIRGRLRLCAYQSTSQRYLCSFVDGCRCYGGLVSWLFLLSYHRA